MKKTKLSVNINKVATIRNARDKDIPNLIHIAIIVLNSKACGITVHPRPDKRHILYDDVYQLKKLIKNYRHKELNVEGYPSSSFLELIQKVKPQQCTLVPDSPKALTSDAGWDFIKHKKLLKTTVKKLNQKGIRTSLFLDPMLINEKQYVALKNIQPDRAELYTGSYADNWNKNKMKNILKKYKKSVTKCKILGIKINAGHDLNQNNLFDLLKALPEIEEVSIGQALIAESLEQGLPLVLKKYLKIIDQAFA